jgi:hypothetical protein
MHLSAFLLISLIPLSLAHSAFAQSATADVRCPTLPPTTVDDLQWVTLQTDSALLCRAVHKGNGAEAFALTMTRKSPFKPDGSLREEEGKIQGKKLWWYRSEIAGNPKELVRETLVKLDSDHVVHVFIRTADSGTMTHYQQLVQGLDFTTPGIATR